MAALKPEKRLQEILTQAKQAGPESVTTSLIEGLPALARIALTARIARRTQRFFPFNVKSARLAIERAIRAAEKVAGGETMTTQEDFAACYEAVLRACELERQQGDKAAAESGAVCRFTARCVYGPEIAYGENAFLANFHLQKAVGAYAQRAGNNVNEIERIHQESRMLRDDLDRLILIAEACGDGWVDPGLNDELSERNDRGWFRMLKRVGALPTEVGKNRERWEKIHQAVRRAGGHFYSPALFDTLKR